MGLGSFFKAVLPYVPVIGDIAGGIMANSAQKKANKANVALQRENQAWEERMANTEWQRGKADMLAAGFNPMLAFSQGGASTPNTSAATVSPQDGLARGVSSAGSKIAQTLQIQRMKIDNDIAEQTRLQSEITTDRMQEMYGAGGVTQEEVEQTKSKTKTMASEARIKEIEKEIAEQTQGANVNSARARAELAQKEVSMRELQILLAGLDIPEKEAMAKWFQTVGAASPAAKAVMTVSQWLKFILGR